ncbi:MAG: hypothetical protein A2W98_05940 [Bacteroidetes bacterium GWF2_33_38]|nr:MAG: hypothetical protein A2W98_05940 [Bacteroidetes bacterium GWF2_33_38]OFY68638.1 MAG: hypothetical protein A2265_09225 [Bacteroidetes bacterium RIFOXYA12_FULL_33_9]OFY91950.1 MAG: hypothetical protein A2236_02140 [Bacteroidetes bacterium RIFOXYA2_FULL_33_7]HBX49600.1 hypothetical protein [Bacteroidales bacterium]
MKNKLFSIVVILTILFTSITNKLYSQVPLPMQFPPISMPELIPFKVGDVWGYSDVSGKIIIAPKYFTACFFYGKIAVVMENLNDKNLTKLITPKDETIIEFSQTPAIFTLSDTSVLIIEIGEYNLDLMTMEKEKYYIVDIHKNKTEITKYDIIEFLKNGYLYAQTENNCFLLDYSAKEIAEANCDDVQKNGLFDKNHQIIVRPEHVHEFKNAFAHLVFDGTVEKFMDKNGNVYECKNPDFTNTNFGWHICPSAIKNGVAILEKDGKVGVLDSLGNVIVPFGKYDKIEEFSDGMAKVYLNEKVFFINSKGKEIIVKYYDIEPSNFSGGFTKVEILNGKYSITNKEGVQLVLKKSYNSLGDFSEGLCRVELNGNYGFIDAKGKEIIPITLEYDEVDAFHEGLCRVKKDGKYGFIDKTGKEIIPIQFAEVSTFKNSYAKLSFNEEDDRNTQIINKKGEILPYSFDKNNLWIADYRIFESPTGNGIVDKNLNVIIPAEYYNIQLYSFGLALANKLKDGNSFYDECYINLKTGVKYCKE